MKKFLFVFITTFFVLSFFVIEDKHEYALKTEEESVEKRAIFFSYLEMNKYVKNKSTIESKKNIKEILNNIKSNGFNTLILHVRPFSDAIYNSSIFPVSDTVKTYGKSPSYDVLKYFVDEAKKLEIEVHAWINPYRISNEEDITLIKEDNPAYEMIKSNDVKVVKNEGIFYNPASKRVNKLIISGIEELLTNYEIDGIHFDDYFYPSTDIDLDNYKQYIQEGGTSSLEDYRYNNILTLLKEVYSVVKSINENAVFGISPEGNIDNNYNKHFLDVKTILRDKGYIDYIMPQIYFGFDNEVRPFIDTLNEWKNLIKNNDIKILPALAFYKVGEYDKYAKSGIGEWIEKNDIISREVEESRKINNYAGFALFRYDYVFSKKEHNKIELNNLKKVLK